MKNPQNIILLLVLIIVILVAAGYYMLAVQFPQKAEAECEATINNQVIPQLRAAAEQECMSAIQQYQETLEQVMQVPACAAALSQ